MKYRLTLALSLLAAAGFSFVQNYPVKPVRLIVPFPPGRTGSRRMGWSWGGDGARPRGWMRRCSSIAAGIVCAVAPTFALPVIAQTYPTKPIRLIVPFPPGGNADVVGRVIGQRVGDLLGQRIVVDNRGGAGGIIGTELTAKSPPDGYTVLLIALGHAVNPSLYSRLPYDTLNDFVFVTHAVSVPNILVVHPSFPARSVRELIALARRSPGKINYGSGGNGTSNHLAGELFRNMAGVNIVRIPYKGSALAMIDLLGGQIDAMFDIIVTGLPHVAAGRLRALAVTGSKRSAAAPDIPSIAETGLPGYEVNGWQGFVVPAGTPRPIVDKLNAAVREALRSADVKDALIRNGAELVGSSPQQFESYVRSEMRKWSKLVADAGIRLEN